MKAETQRILDQMARAGFCVSLVYGPSGNYGPAGESREIWWSVNVMNPALEFFERPQLARDFDHAVEIAVVHCRKLGWLDLVGYRHLTA
jgi:hypothetical protein